MLMNLLPGLRELRAPLAAGYLWLTSLWLGLSRAGWLPTKRPPGNGEVARLWDLGGTLGKTLVLAAITFLAYLIGSFLEIYPDGQLATCITPIVLFRRSPTIIIDTGEHITSSNLNLSRYIARSLSVDAREDLISLLERRHLINYESDNEKVNQFAGDQIIGLIIREMPQLASRLLVKNKDLYGKYDRHMAEAAVRINVSIPLTLLLILATWFSGTPIWLRLVLTIIVSILGFMLIRQGFLRKISAQDTIVQALIINEIESRHIPPEKLADEGPEEPSASKERQTTPSGEQAGTLDSRQRTGSDGQP